MPDVKMPDGTMVRFPDDMPPDQIRGMIAQKFPDAVKGLAPPQSIAPPAAQDFTPPDGQYADYWKGKTFNSQNAPGFDPSKPTVYRDQFGEMSIPDSNDASGQFSPDQLQQMFATQPQPQTQPAPVTRSPGGPWQPPAGPTGASPQDLQAALNRAAALKARQTGSAAGPKGDFQGPPGFLTANRPPPTATPLDNFAHLIGYPAPRGGPDAFVNGAADAMTLGWGDELAAGVGSMAGQGSYEDELAKIRQRIEETKQNQPGAYFAGQVAGSVPAAAAGGEIVAGPRLAVNVGKGIVAGAAQGGIYGAGASDNSDRAQGAINGAIVGGAMGGAAPVVARAVGNAVGGVAGRASVPEIDAIDRNADAFYGAARSAGVTVKPTALNELARRSKLAMTGLNATITPKSAAALDEIAKAAKAGTQPSLDTIDQLRQIAGQAAQSADPNERRQAGRLINIVDSWLDGLKPSDIVGGNDPAQAVEWLKQARALWAIKSKAQTINGLLYDAEGNLLPDPQIRTGFQNLLRNKNKLRGYTEDEVRMLSLVARGGTGGGVKKAIAAFAPKGPVTGILYGALGVSNPVAAGALGVTAAATKQWLKYSTRRAAEEASATIRNGGRVPFAPAAAQSAEANANTVLSIPARVAPQTLFDLAYPRAVANQ